MEKVSRNKRVQWAYEKYPEYKRLYGELAYHMAARKLTPNERLELGKLILKREREEQ